MVHFSSRVRVEGVLFAVVLALLAVSVLMVFSTTALTAAEDGSQGAAGLKKHLVQIVLGLVFLGFFSRLHPRYLYRCAAVLLVISLVSLVVVLIPGIGHVAGGARRWFALGPLRIQPGEIAKFAAALYTASYIGRHHDRMQRFLPGTVVPLGIAVVFSGLLLLQPDFGTTAILLLVVFAELLTASRLLHLVGLAASAVVVLCMLVVVSPYRFKRFESFLDPFRDANKSGYQLVQSLIAVGSGGLTGAGLGAGKQKLYYLPAAHTDFIFAVISEELGLAGALGVVALFLILGACGLTIARHLARDPFLCSLALGCTCLIVVPAFLNMAVVTGLLPTKGLVLPLVAYGGTAMIVNLSLVGILLRLSRMEA